MDLHLGSFIKKRQPVEFWKFAEVMKRLGLFLMIVKVDQMKAK